MVGAVQPVIAKSSLQGNIDYGDVDYFGVVFNFWPFFSWPDKVCGQLNMWLCDLWGIYNSDNWEPEFMKVFVTLSDTGQHLQFFQCFTWQITSYAFEIPASVLLSMGSCLSTLFLVKTVSGGRSVKIRLVSSALDLGVAKCWFPKDTIWVLVLISW